MDRFSNLPEEVLCHILSFLTTKDAALTSVLAKRWRNLLAFVPNLAIDDSVFLHPEEGKHDREDIIQSFMNFVDRVLALRGDSPVKKVSIQCRSKVDSDRVDSWISNVLERGVSDLDLDIMLNWGRDLDEDDNYRPSPKCFKCSTLVKLKVQYGTDIGWLAGSIFLPRLKTLVLDAVRVNSVEFEILLHALPALEELVMDDMLWQDSNMTLSSASLKSLTINDDDCLSSLSLDTPSLVYFKYRGYIVSDYPVVNMKNLVNAQISFMLTDEDVKGVREPNNVWPNDEVALAYSNVWKLFHGIQHVLSLSLCPDAIEVLSLCCESMPVFKNLKMLIINSNEGRGWQAIPVLLRNCPHLETLVINGLIHDVTDKCGDACDCISQENKGLSLTSCPVKVLEIEGFRGTVKEMKMIKHFLEYFPCLKRLDVFIEEDDPIPLKNPELYDAVVEMFDLYNKSSSCNVQLLSSDDLFKKWSAQGHM